MEKERIKNTDYGSFNTEDGSGRAAIASRRASFSIAFAVSIPRTVAGGLQFGILDQHEVITVVVSIPRTVAGGLQFKNAKILAERLASFNTEDGSGRAAICSSVQQCLRRRRCFNTEDGSGRAAIDYDIYNGTEGMMFQYRGR